jgi:ABC-2 type transport system ATP-binding protein
MVSVLLHRPIVLLLDEPTFGLDVVMQKKIRIFIKDYNRQHGATIMLTSHYMEDVAALAERALIINHGRLVYDGSISALTERYAPYKVLVATFSRPVSSADLAGLGKVVSNADNEARIEVPRDTVAARAAALLKKFPVADLAIEEAQLDDIIHDLFTATNREEEKTVEATPETEQEREPAIV